MDENNLPILLLPLVALILLFFQLFGVFLVVSRRNSDGPFLAENRIRSSQHAKKLYFERINQIFLKESLSIFSYAHLIVV